MNLHRTTGQADWKKVAAADYNFFQKIAAATHGIVAPANIVTFVGFGVVVYGLAMILQSHFWWGLLLVSMGRLLDIVDGVVAEATGTKSAFGELCDAAVDKVETLLTIVVIILADMTDWWIVVALIVPQVVIPLLVLYKKKKHIQVHPTRQGKVSMALVWVGIVGLIVIKALGSAQVVAAVVYGVIILSLLLGLYALWQYGTGRDQD